VITSNLAIAPPLVFRLKQTIRSGA
jgi:hypothetical protein